MRRSIAFATVAVLTVALSARLGAGAEHALVAAGPAQLVTQPDHFVTEFETAIDPTNPDRRAVAAIDADKPGTGFGCAVYTSTDAGRTWTVRDPLGAVPGSDVGFSGDPRIVIDKNGRMHVVCLMAIGLRMGYVYSEDFGATWSPVRLIPRIDRDPLKGLDKPALWVGDSGRVMVCAVQSVQDPNGRSRPTIGIAISDDSGETWRAFEPPAFAGYSGTCTSFASDAEGNVFMGFLSLGGPNAQLLSFGTFRTPDEGETWDRPAIVGRQMWPGGTPTGDLLNDEFGPTFNKVITFFPPIAVNRVTGTVFGAYAAASSDDTRWTLRVGRSIDGGVTYQSVTAPPAPSEICEQQMYSPTLHADSSGRVFLEFICSDRLSKSETMTREVWLTASVDDGSSWLAPVRLVHEQHEPCGPYTGSTTSQFNPCWRFYDGADYWFLTHADDGVHAYWVDYVGGTSSIRSQVYQIM